MTSKDKKVAIVTGASTGLGFDLSKALLEKGYRVVMAANNEKRLQKAYGALGSPEDATTFAGDIGHNGAGKKLVAFAVKTFGRVDVLVNNAGVFEPKPFLEVDEDYLDRFLSINLKGTYFTTQAAIPELQKQGGGHVINIGTVLASYALGGVPITAPISSKGAIHALTVQLAAEFSGDNIRVNTIAPGIIRTPIHARNGIDADGLAGLHLLNRIGEPEEITNAALYLLESGFVTGTELRVDGGTRAGHHVG